MTQATTKDLADRLSYWETVTDGQKRHTTQALQESTANLARNGRTKRSIAQLSLFANEIRLPNRRVLRYGSHGIHEYRGKFFPQLVRALLNWAGVRRGSVIADTMCGSGTTIVEATLLGCTGLGLDLNPLSVFISRTKCEILHANPTSVTKTYSAVREKLLVRSGWQRDVRLTWLETLPDYDQDYLRAWFSLEVLKELERIVDAIRAVKGRAERHLLWVCLSNILRRVSWQKEDDLRVRREIKHDVEPVKEFLEDVTRSVRTLLAFLLQNDGAPHGRGIVLEGDARAPHLALGGWRGRIDAVVTSPPYATALPYLDTDRLSLIYLRLLPRREHRRRDILMVGNREITDRVRHEYWDTYIARKHELPSSIVRLIDHVHRKNTHANVGFRRKNLPALLAKYFMDMGNVFEGLRDLVKPGAPAFVVIGCNHTYAGGERVEIDTATLLGDLAKLRGLVLEETIPMEMLVSRDIFRKNASASETILVLRRS
ncbi:MAG: hypothetical protein HY694_13665 [Deltaproteobacteria bacterium]|nr:hypothetical protein [Deltaproteobacteria bacterium]